MTRGVTGWWGAVLRVLGLLAALPVVLVLALHVFLNVWLPVLMNRQPERIRVSYDVAWMVVPGTLEVRGLDIRQQSLIDQWILHVDRVSGGIAVGDLRQHIIHVTRADASGASFLYRPRLDAPSRVAPPLAGPPPAANFVEVAPIFTPEIPGLSNPPDSAPEDIYPTAKPWRVVLDDVHVDGIRELWMGDYRYTGNAVANGALTLEARTWIEVEGVTLRLGGGAITRGGEPLLTGVAGQVDLQVVGTNAWTGEGRSVFNVVSGKVALTSDVSSLSFLEFYLQSAPWLRLSGGDGQLAVNLYLVDGAFQDGSTVSVDVHDILARFLSYSIVGDGKIRIAVDAASGAPQTTIGVDFLDFAVTQAGDVAPHATGRGFRVIATTPDVALDRPFTSLQVVLDLPEAVIPDVGVYNTYLPHATGLTLRSGTGTVHGRLEVSTLEGDCHGELFLAGEGVRGALDDLTVSGDVALHVLVPAGNVERGSYDISGSSFALHDIRVISGGSQRDGKDDSRAWWAELEVPRGAVNIGAPIFLDGALRVKARDTIPFITIFSEKQQLPGWVRGMLAVRPVTGKARIRVGEDILRLSDFELHAGKFEVQMDLLRRQAMEGKLYARFGALSMGLGMQRGVSQLHLMKARRWYDAEPDP